MSGLTELNEWWQTELETTIAQERRVALTTPDINENDLDLLAVVFGQWVRRLVHAIRCGVITRDEARQTRGVTLGELLERRGRP